MDERRKMPIIAALGMILAYPAVASSPVLIYFAPLPLHSAILHGASVLAGLVLGTYLNEPAAIFYGVVVVALITTLIFSSVFVLEALLNGAPLLDLVLLYAFQQSVPRLIFVCALGCVGAFLAVPLRSILGRL